MAAETDITETKFFSDIPAVLEYLQNSGWKVSRTSLYRDHGNGKLRPRDDGGFHIKDVDRYAKTWLKQKSTGKRVREATDELQRRKLELEQENLLLDNQKKKLALDKELGKLIPREQLEIELAAWTGIVEAGLKHWIQSNAAGWIRMMVGDVKKVGELINAMNADLDELINNYSGDREYEVVFDASPDAETESESE